MGTGILGSQGDPDLFMPSLRSNGPVAAAARL